jgi:hypothetical protein
VEGIHDVGTFYGLTNCYPAGTVVRIPHESSSHQIRFKTDDTTIFSSYGGSSWHRADANFIFWVRFIDRVLKIDVAGKQAHSALSILWLCLCHRLHYRHMGGC